MYGAHPRQFNTLRNVKSQKGQYTIVCEITGLRHSAKKWEFKDPNLQTLVRQIRIFLVKIVWI